MADENLDPEIIRKLNEGIELSAEELNKLARSASGANKALDSLGGTLLGAGRQILNYTKKMADGEKGASTFNDAIEKSADQLAKWLELIPFVGKALGATARAASDYAKAVNQASDRLYKSYQGLAETGITAADGMMGVAEAAQRMGYGIDQIGLDQFAQLMTKASQDLALMSGSAVGGRKAFTELSGDIVKGPVGESFMNLGFSIEAQNEAIAGFVRQQVSLGRIQTLSTEQIRQGAIEYVKELDVLTKLTGASRKEMESQMDANRRNERFRAAIEKVRREQGDVAANNLERNMAALSVVAPDTAAGLMDIAAGFVNTEAAQRAFQQGMMDVPRLLTGDFGTALNAVTRAAGQTTDAFGSLGEVGAFGETFGNLTELLKLRGMSEKDIADIQAQMIKEQRDQLAGMDPATRAQTQLQRAQMTTRDSLQTLILNGIEPATRALTALAKAGALAAGVPEAAVMGAGGAGTAGGKFTAGSAMGPGPEGGLVGAVKRFFGFGGGPTEAGWEDYIKFTGGTGSVEHFKKLQPSVQEAFARMAQDYFNVTGQKLQVNSSFRSPEEQMRIDPGANPRAAPGMSLHNMGRAIDIQSEQAAFLESSGLLGQYGFKSGRAFNDPPHIFMRTGGIATGPKSGYNAMLHGTEAVVPLPDGKTIPVEMPTMQTEIGRQVGLMSDQISKLDELISLMRNQNTISTKILQHSVN